MTEDMAKAPRAKPVPAVPMLDRQISIAKQRLKLVATDDARRFYAEQIVGLKFERGDYPDVIALTKEVRRGLVSAFLKEQFA